MTKNKEIWKSVVGYEGFYEVSSCGRVRSLDRVIKTSNKQSRIFKGRILQPAKVSSGYLAVSLSKKNIHRLCLIHRLLGYAFLGLEAKLDIDHINYLKEDNRLENLRVCTRAQNIQRARPKQKQKYSKYKGVNFQVSPKNYKLVKQWRAVSNFKGKRKIIGQFYTENEACKAYNEYVKKNFGEFAFINETIIQEALNK